MSQFHTGRSHTKYFVLNVENARDHSRRGSVHSASEVAPNYALPQYWLSAKINILLNLAVYNLYHAPAPLTTLECSLICILHLASIVITPAICANTIIIYRVSSWQDHVLSLSNQVAI